MVEQIPVKDKVPGSSPGRGAKLDDSAKSSTASNGLRKEYLSFRSITDRFDSTKLIIACFSLTSEPSKIMRMRRHRFITVDTWMWYS